MNDITNEADVITFVDAFYQQIRQDPVLAPLFALRIPSDGWPVHLERMYSFWNTVLFKQATYKGNPFARHAQLPVEAEHFDRWVSLFHTTIDARFAGERAEEVKLRAKNMALMFSSKITYLRQNPGYQNLI